MPEYPILCLIHGDERHLHEIGRPRCYVKSPTMQYTFQSIPGLISCVGVTKRWGLLSHAQNAVRSLSIKQVEAYRK